MAKPNKDRRRYKRVVFTVEDGIVGVLNPPDNGTKPITATVMDISSGGIRLLFKPILKDKIREGDKLVLSEIRGMSSSQLIVNVDAEVKWISEDELSKSIGLGVEFLNILSEDRQQLDELVEFWYMQKL